MGAKIGRSVFTASSGTDGGHGLEMLHDAIIEASLKTAAASAPFDVQSRAMTIFSALNKRSSVAVASANVRMRRTVMAREQIFRFRVLLPAT